MSKRILVMEDEKDNRQIIRDMLPLLTMRSRKPRTAGKRLRQSRNSTHCAGSSRCARATLCQCV
jgi:hypothetical protein